VIVSFTGSQIGTTDKQKEAVRFWFEALGATELSHGDCVGSDDDAHKIAKELGLKIIIRPCTLSDKRAYNDGDLVHPPEKPLVRNPKIVDDGQVLIATPNTYEEILRSGTWATIRYARRIGCKIIKIFPDGTVEVENDKDAAQ
jgi:hypothetical protein